MAFEKDIVLRITANAELAAITTAIAKLQELQKASQGIFSTSGVAAPLAAANQQAAGLTQNIRASANAQGTLLEVTRNSVLAHEKDFGAIRKVGQALKAVVDESGNVSGRLITEKFKGPLGSGFSAEATSSGSLKTSENLIQAEVDKRKLGLAQIAALNEDEKRIRQTGLTGLAANKEDESRTRKSGLERIAANNEEEKRTRQAGLIQVAANKEEEIRGRKSGLTQLAGLSEDEKRTRQNGLTAIAANKEDESRTRKDGLTRLAADNESEKRVRKQGLLEAAANNEDLIRTRRKGLAELAAININQARDKAASDFERQAAVPGRRVVTREVLEGGQLVNQKVLLDSNNNAILRLSESTQKLSGSNAALTGEINKSSDSLQNAAGKVLLWTVATGAVFGSIRAAKSVVTNFKDVELATAALSVVARGFGTSQAAIDQGARNVTQEILKLKVAFGSTGGEALQAATTFARLGLSQQQTVDATKTALLASNVAFISAADAANLLASAYQQFQLSTQDIPKILDNLNTLSNTNRVTTDDLLQSISRAGSVFREAGGSIQELGALTATVAEVTSRSGSEIGNAFKTISSRLGDSTVQAKVFAETGVAISNVAGDIKPITQIFQELALALQGASDAERANVTTTIAGVRQRNLLQAALDNVFRSQVNVINQLTDTTSAASENEKITGTLTNKIQQLQAALERLAVIIGESGVGEALKKTVTILTTFVNALAGIPGIAVTVVAILTLYAGALIASAIGSAKLFGSLVDMGKGFTNLNRFISSTVADLFVFRTATLTATEANNAFALSLNKVSNTRTGKTGFGSGAQNFSNSIPIEAPKAAGSALASGFQIIGSIAGKFFIAGLIAELALSLFEAINNANRDARAKLLDLGPESKTKKKSDAAAKETDLAEKDRQATEETIKLFASTEATLNKINRRREAGLALTKEEVKAQSVINDILNRQISLDPVLKEKSARGEINALDLASGKITLQDALNGKKDIELQKLERELALNKQSIADKKEILATGSKTTGRFSPENAFNPNPLAAIQEARLANTTIKLKPEEKRALEDDLKELEKETRKFENKILRVSIEQVGFKDTNDTLRKFRDAIADIQFESKLTLDFNLSLETNDIEKAVLKIRSLNEEIANLRKINAEQIKLGGAPTNEEIRDQEAAQSAIRKKIDEEELGIKRIEQLRARALANEKSQGLARIREKASAIVASGSGPELLADLNRERAILAEKIHSEDVLKNLRQKIEAELATSPSSARRKVLIENRQEIDEKLLTLPVQIEQQKNKVLEQALDTNKKITDEIKKQTDETKKQIAALSDEDVAKVRIAIESIKQGTFKQLAPEQFLGLGQKSRDFFQNKLQPLVPGFDVVKGGIGGLFGLPPSTAIKGLQNQNLDTSFARKLLQDNPIIAPDQFKGTINTGTFQIGAATVNFGSIVSPGTSKPSEIDTAQIDAVRKIASEGFTGFRPLPAEVAGTKVKDFASQGVQDFFAQNAANVGRTGEEQDAITKILQAVSQTPAGQRTFGEVGATENQVIAHLADIADKLATLGTVNDIPPSEFVAGAAQSINFNLRVNDLSTPLEGFSDALTNLTENIVETALERIPDKINTISKNVRSPQAPRGRNR
jgi:TP901 family phage tail tape measure protein